MDTEKGLLTPVIKNAGDLNLGGLARSIADVAARTRDNKIMPDELSGGTFTIDEHRQPRRPVRHPDPEPAAGRHPGHRHHREAPGGVNDPELGEVIAIRSMVYLALTYDHRLVDGADAARFLGTVKARLEEGRFEADLGL